MWKECHKQFCLIAFRTSNSMPRFSLSFLLDTASHLGHVIFVVLRRYMITPFCECRHHARGHIYTRWGYKRIHCMLTKRAPYRPFLLQGSPSCRRENVYCRPSSLLGSLLLLSFHPSDLLAPLMDGGVWR